MLTWKFTVHLNRSLVELEGLVIEKTEVAYLKSFSCKKDISSHVRSCKFSDSENDVDLILSLAGVTADLDTPRIWTPRSISASGFGPPPVQIR